MPDKRLCSRSWAHADPALPALAVAFHDKTRNENPTYSPIARLIARILIDRSRFQQALFQKTTSACDVTHTQEALNMSIIGFRTDQFEGVGIPDEMSPDLYEYCLRPLCFAQFRFIV